MPESNALQGHIESTPVIDRDSNVYIATTTGGVFALRRDGTQIWHKSEGRDVRILSPVLDIDSLYVGTSSAVAFALDLATGEERWRRQYSAFAGGDAWSVTVSQGLVLVAGALQQRQWGGNDQVFALSTVDGSTQWVYSPGSMLYNFMPSVVDDKVLFINHAGAIHQLDLATGERQWVTAGSEHGSTTAGVSVGSNGLAYTNFNTAGNSGGRLQAYDARNGAERWGRELVLEASAAPVVGCLGASGRLGVVVGLGPNIGGWSLETRDAQAMLRAFDADTGADLWNFTTPHQMLHGSAGLYSTPGEDSVPDTWSTAAIGGDGTVYVGWEGGVQYAIDGDTGAVLSSHVVGFGDQGEPAIARDFVVIPSIGKVVAYETSPV